MENCSQISIIGGSIFNQNYAKEIGNSPFRFCTMRVVRGELKNLSLKERKAPPVSSRGRMDEEKKLKRSAHSWMLCGNESILINISKQDLLTNPACKNKDKLRQKEKFMSLNFQKYIFVYFAETIGKHFESDSENFLCFHQFSVKLSLTTWRQMSREANSEFHFALRQCLTVTDFGVFHVERKKSRKRNEAK